MRRKLRGEPGGVRSGASRLLRCVLRSLWPLALRPIRLDLPSPHPNAERASACPDPVLRPITDQSQPAHSSAAFPDQARPRPPPGRTTGGRRTPGGESSSLTLSLGVSELSRQEPPGREEVGESRVIARSCTTTPAPAFPPPRPQQCPAPALCSRPPPSRTEQGSMATRAPAQPSRSSTTSLDDKEKQDSDVDLEDTLEKGSVDYGAKPTTSPLWKRVLVGNSNPSNDTKRAIEPPSDHDRCAPLHLANGLFLISCLKLSAGRSAQEYS